MAPVGSATRWYGIPQERISASMVSSWPMKCWYAVACRPTFSSNRRAVTPCRRVAEGLACHWTYVTDLAVYLRITIACTLLGRVAPGAQRPIVVKLSRERSVGLSVGACVCASVGLSSALWKNAGSHPDAVWHHKSDGSRNEAGSAVWGSVHRKEYFWRQIWGAPL